MNIFRLTILLSVTLFHFNVEGQQVDLQKTTIIGGNKSIDIKQVQPLPDGSAWWIGYTTDSTGSGDIPLCSSPSGKLKLAVGKVDSNGNNEWVKVYCDYNVETGSCPPSHPGYCVGGLDPLSPDLLLTRLDCQGRVQWQKRWGSSEVDETKKVIKTRDGGYLILGASLGDDGDVPFNYRGASTSFLYADIVVIKTDSLGNKEWLKVYGSATDDFGAEVFEIGNSYYVVAGTDGMSNDHDFADTNPYPGNSYCYLMKLDSSGALIWSRSLGNITPNDACFDDRDSSFLIVTSAHTNVPPIYKNDGNAIPDYGLVKVNLNGQVIWAKHFGDSNYHDLPTGITVGPNNTYVVIGQSISEQFNAVPPRIGYYDGLIYWIDSAGQQVTRKFFGTVQSERAGKICLLAGNKLLAGVNGGSSSNPYTEGLWFFGTGVTSGASFSLLQVFTTSVPQLCKEKYESLIVYPNPSNGYIRIQLPEGNRQMFLQVFSEDGKLLGDSYAHPNQAFVDIETREWVNGSYIITCSGLKKYLAKVQIQH